MAEPFNGFGTGFVGRSDPGPDGTYVLTEWFMLFFIPVYPIRSVRVLAQGALEGIPFLYIHRPMRVQAIPLDRDHVRRVYLGLILFVAVAGVYIWLCASVIPRR